ncbi:MAG: response regulator [Polyangiaceae bacterium]|nr:response regulator [Polyangiaceae bacterium]NUQ73753.1 response regulator [Polyangiaceae bacterium]
MTTDLARTVLLIEDEPQMRRFLRASLTSRDYRLIEAETAEEGMRLGTSHNPDLILMDLSLPDGDGIDLTRRFREWTRAPILVISARGREDDKVSALDAGADDYLTKPFGVNELLARIRAALRRSQEVTGPGGEPVIDIGSLHIDLARREVRIGDREVHLTPIEYKMLVLLAKNAGKVLTHKQIVKEVWGPSRSLQPHHVRVHMAELRKKIEAEAARPKYLVTEPGVGYRLRDRADE